MTKPIIVIKLKPNRYGKLESLATTVYLQMNGNPNFINPQPALADLQVATLELTNAITNWGTKGHRGSHTDFVVLTDKAQRLHKLLTQLGKWCMTTVNPDTTYEEQAAVLSSSGFVLKRPKTSQGILQKVQNFRRVVPANLGLDRVMLCWKKPLDVYTNASVKSYKIFRNTTVDFTTAVCIDAVPSTTFIDLPGTGSWCYWVVPVNNKGNGVTSEGMEVKMA